LSSEDEKPKILVLSGPSGSGKSTIVNRLLELAPVKLMKAVSATTRPPRDNEKNGEDYYFLSCKEFNQKKQNGEFLEVAEVFSSGFWYGTLKSEIRRAQKSGAWAFLEIDVEGALRVMEEFPQAVTIFLTTPSAAVFEDRLRSRGTESEEAIQRRLETSREELKYASRYRYRVENDNLDQAVEQIANILKTVEMS